MADSYICTVMGKKGFFLFNRPFHPRTLGEGGSSRKAALIPAKCSGHVRGEGGFGSGTSLVLFRRSTRRIV